MVELTENSSAARAGAPDGRFRVAIEFAILGDLRFLSHHDELRLLRRALVRARWPIAYSGGFNPRPRLVLPLPRSVGICSTSEWATIDLCAPRAPRALYESLSATLPADCRLQRVVAPAAAGRPQARAVEYEVELDQADATAIAARRDSLLALDELVVRRERGPGQAACEVDIRRFIENVDVSPSRLHVRLTIDQQRTAKPDEVLAALGVSAGRIRRARVEWDIDLAGPPQWPKEKERNKIGNQESQHTGARVAAPQDQERRENGRVDGR